MNSRNISLLIGTTLLVGVLFFARENFSQLNLKGAVSPSGTTRAQEDKILQFVNEDHNNEVTVREMRRSLQRFGVAKSRTPQDLIADFTAPDGVVDRADLVLMINALRGLLSNCGNGVKEAVEACDDGNKFSGDGCALHCEIEPGYGCTTNAAGLSTCSPLCGNGIVESGELCDDRNSVANDGCTSCLIDQTWICIPGTNGSVCQRCGNGIREGTEVCDTTQNGVACVPLATQDSCTYCNTSCTNTTVQNQCGNGNMNTGETCDQGSNNRTAGDGCDASCQIEQGYSCGRQGNVSVCSPLCGNGVLNPGETCDQGSNNRTSGDGCSNVCSIEANFRCTGTPSFCISYTDYVRALAGITSMDTDPDAISRKILDLQIRMVLDPITAIYDINNDGVYVDSNGIMNATDYGIINDQLESISPTPTTSN